MTLFEVGVLLGSAIYGAGVGACHNVLLSDEITHRQRALFIGCALTWPIALPALGVYALYEEWRWQRQIGRFTRKE